ncbi:MAG: methylmalonyl Co-A mutase-associated GTPase MeaB [Gemmatimonadales bacterium]
MSRPTADASRAPTYLSAQMMPDRLLDGLERRDPAALARAISLVENQRDGFERVLSHIHRGAGRARRIGVTGPPGAGKSTLTERLIQRFRAQGLTVAVVAVDPTSPFSGGALLGDRIRMESVSLDPGVFIRSMATRGSVGGLATTTEEVADVLDAYGFDRILIETVGVGQTELDIARTAQTTVLVLVPESGDGLQTLKAGVMEIADVYVVNKSDRPGADKLKSEVEVMLGIRRGNAFRHIAPHHRLLPSPPSPPSPPEPRAGKDGEGRGKTGQGGAWEAPVIMTVASRGEGIEELAGALDAHYAQLERGGTLAARRRERLAARTRAVVNRTLRQWIWEETRAEELLAQRLDAVADGRRSPYEAAAEIVSHVRAGGRREEGGTRR